MRLFVAYKQEYFRRPLRTIVLTVATAAAATATIAFWMQYSRARERSAEETRRAAEETILYDSLAAVRIWPPIFFASPEKSTARLRTTCRLSIGYSRGLFVYDLEVDNAAGIVARIRAAPNAYAKITVGFFDKQQFLIRKFVLDWGDLTQVKTADSTVRLSAQGDDGACNTDALGYASWNIAYSLPPAPETPIGLRSRDSATGPLRAPMTAPFTDARLSYYRDGPGAAKDKADWIRSQAEAIQRLKNEIDAMHAAHGTRNQAPARRDAKP